MLQVLHYQHMLNSDSSCSTPASLQRRCQAPWGGTLEPALTDGQEAVIEDL